MTVCAVVACVSGVGVWNGLKVYTDGMTAEGQQER